MQIKCPHMLAGQELCGGAPAALLADTISPTSPALNICCGRASQVAERSVHAHGILARPLDTVEDCAKSLNGSDVFPHAPLHIRMGQAGVPHHTLYLMDAQSQHHLGVAGRVLTASTWALASMLG